MLSIRCIGANALQEVGPLAGVAAAVMAQLVSADLTDCESNLSLWIRTDGPKFFRISMSEKFTNTACFGAYSVDNTSKTLIINNWYKNCWAYACRRMRRCSCMRE
jgi:hypothetical protein